MRAAILSDIHSNLPALEAVLNAIRGRVDETWCLGDIVGYGANPHQCLERLRQEKHVSVVGNHDLAAIDRIDTSDFNTLAIIADRWTGTQLTADDRAYLEGLPLKLERGDFTLVHGSPRDPVREYLFYPEEALPSFDHFGTPYCLVGHTHVPVVFRLTAGGCLIEGGGEITLAEDRLIINPGGVGQPRDGDPRASYAIFDSDRKSVKLYRVPYDIGAAQTAIRAAGLPEPLAYRLERGM